MMPAKKPTKPTSKSKRKSAPKRKRVGFWRRLLIALYIRRKLILVLLVLLVCAAAGAAFWYRRTGSVGPIKRQLPSYLSMSTDEKIDYLERSIQGSKSRKKKELIYDFLNKGSRQEA